MGRATGITEEQLRDIASYEKSAAFTRLEKLVVAYAVEMTRTPVDVPAELFSALRAELDDAQMVELTAAIAWENWRARFNHALEIQSGGLSEGAFCPLPERHDR